jgi:hypothetical protein
MPPTRKRGGAIKNSLIVDTPDKLSLMNKLMQRSGPGVVSYVLVYAPWCGACTRFRENVWDPSLNVPTTHNRIAVKDDVFNNSPMAKDVPDLKFLPSMFVVKDGVIQLHKKPGGDTAIIPTPKTKEELLQMANVKLKPEATVNNTRANAIKDIFVKTESPVSTAIENANKNVIIANNATKEVKKMTVALNNASRNTLRTAIQNVSKAVVNAQAAAAAAKNSANAVKKMMENAKGNLNTKTNANAKAAVAAAAGAAIGAELAAAAATNAVKKNNNGNAVAVMPEDVSEEVNISQPELNFEEGEEDEQMPELVGQNTLEPEPISQLEYNNSIVPNIVTQPMAPEANVNSKNPTPEVAPQTGGRRTRRSKGKLYRMLVALNKKPLKRKTRSKKLTRQRR